MLPVARMSWAAAGATASVAAKVIKTSDINCRSRAIPTEAIKQRRMGETPETKPIGDERWAR
jgi:hypothetical protein